MKSKKLLLLLLSAGLGFGLAVLLLTGLASRPAIAALLADPLINEFVLNHTGTDDHEYVEIYGDPLADYHGYTLLQIEGDAGYGRLDSVDEVGDTDASGFWETPFYEDHFENGTLTLLLVQGFSGALGQDLDLDDDGLLDVFPWTEVVDGVAVTDGDIGDHVYTAPLLDPNFDGVNFTPGGASRLPDGSFQGPSSGWVRNDFDGFGLPGFIGTPQVGEAANTPGSPNLAALPGIALFKQADPLVLPGGLLTYTLNIANHTNLTLTGVVITDSLPVSASFGAVLDGGAWDGSQVRWDIASLAPSQSQTLHWVVNAPSQPGFQLTNDLYRVSAANFLTDTLGQPIATCVLRQLSIAQIQGTSFLSPQRGECVRTSGIVTGHYRGYAPAAGSFGGFFMQDAAGDGDPQTSEGLFVAVGSAGMPDLQPGAQVEVWGTVQEFSEYDGAACISGDCQTRLQAAAAHVFVTASGPPLVPEEYAPPGSETANIAYAEAHEGMLVSLPLTDVVVGPTRSGVFHVLPAAEGAARVLAGSSQDGAQLGSQLRAARQICWLAA
jgi:uncharacterized repeat protein (TIGR01451 family)